MFLLGNIDKDYKAYCSKVFEHMQNVKLQKLVKISGRLIQTMDA